jgi:hypothetical protein
MCRLFARCAPGRMVLRLAVYHALKCLKVRRCVIAFYYFESGEMHMKDDDDLFDLQRELFLERKKKFGQREDSANGQAAPVKYRPIDTGEECVGG